VRAARLIIDPPGGTPLQQPDDDARDRLAGARVDR